MNESFYFISTILSIHILAWFTPWPLFLLLLRNALLYSRRIAFSTAIGIALGNVVHVTYSIFGIYFLFGLSPRVTGVLQVFGVGYLLFLGIKTLTSLSSLSSIPDSLDKKNTMISLAQGVRMGFFANIMSPKASLFFLTIFSTIFASGQPTWVVILLAFLLPLNSLIFATFYSFLFTQKKTISFYQNYQKPITIVLACGFFLLAILLAFSNEKS